MAWLVNLVAAEEDEIESVGMSALPVKEWSGIQLRDFGSEKLATLHCLLSGDSLDDALAAYEPVWDGGEDNALVLRLPDEINARLAELDEEALEQVAEELSATEEFELTGWPQEQVLDMLLQLGELARLAESQGQVLLAWLHPLRT